jgi:hypothetical protein
MKLHTTTAKALQRQALTPLPTWGWVVGLELGVVIGVLVQILLRWNRAKRIRPGRGGGSTQLTTNPRGEYCSSKGKSGRASNRSLAWFDSTPDQARASA